MFVVNFVSGYQEVPRWLHFEHTYCSYHDTVMPMFFIAVGFALRLVCLRRCETEGQAATYRKLAMRGMGLILLGVVVYHLTGSFDRWDRLCGAWAEAGPSRFFLNAMKRGPFEALTHIGLTTLFVLPVLAASVPARVLYAMAAGGLHIYLSATGYYDWNMAAPPGINGGPLGFLTWTIPTIAGTLAHDWVTRERTLQAGGAGTMLVCGLCMMALGYGLSCLNRIHTPNEVPEAVGVVAYLAPPPFVPPPDKKRAEEIRNYWTMSQRAGSVPYQLFAAGVGLVVLAGFRVVCDGWGLRWTYLDMLGRNALAAYLVHRLADDAVSPFVPRDAPAWYVWAAFGIYLGITTLFLRFLNKNQLYLKI